LTLLFKALSREGTAVKLTGKQRRYLRSLGHSLDPVVQIGKLGLTESVEKAVGAAIERHELVKVRLGTECPDARDDVATRLSASLKAELAGAIGKTFLLYRRHPKEPVIKLPAE